MAKIEWKGGECPVNGDTFVKVYRKDGGEWANVAMNCIWEHEGDSLDIIAYEVIEEEPNQITEDTLWKDFAVSSFKRYVAGRIYTYDDCALYAAQEADEMIKAWSEMMKARAK